MKLNLYEANPTPEINPKTPWVHPYTPKISLAILLTVYYIVLVMVV